MRNKFAISLFCTIALTVSSVLPAFSTQAKRSAPKPTPSQAAATKTSAATQTPTENSEQPKFALLIGIKDYLPRNGWTSLDAPDEDVKDMKALLMSRKFEFPANHIATLTGQVKHDDIINAFKNHLIANAKKYPGKNPLVIFYYSGHGSQKRDDNNDETDGYDETIVPYDSAHRDGEGTGKNTDVTDDEINALVSELRNYTNNVTLIFDSCRSGAISRGTAKSRWAPPDLREPVKKPSEKIVEQKDGPRFDMVNPNTGFVTISGCLSTQSSWERDWKNNPKIKKPNGVLTYYLIEELKKATPETSYVSLIEKVAIGVRKEFSNQEPQIEGNVRSAIFGGAAKVEDPFIKILKVEGNKVTLDAGKILGINVGAQIGIFSSDATVLRGAEGAKKFLTNATVKAVDNNNAIAEMPPSEENAKVSQVTEKSRAAIFNARLLEDPVRVSLGSGGRALPSDEIAVAPEFTATVTASLQERGLIENELIQLVDTQPKARGQNPQAAASDLVLVRRKFSKEFPAPQEYSENEEVYYFAEGGSGAPVFGVFAKVSDGESASRTLANVLENYVKQQNLIALINDESSLSAITVSLIPIAAEYSTNLRGEKELKSAKELPERNEEDLKKNGYTAENPSFPQEYHFKLKLENQTEDRLFVTLINISTDGGIKVILSSPLNEPLEPKRSVKTTIYKTSEPTGTETFKVIVTKKHQDFSVLEAQGITRSKGKGALSPLARLLNQSGTKRRSEPVGEVSQYSWGTKQVQMIVGKNRL
jgi:hypothetical protein